MANLQQLENALIAAHNAGDTKSAQMLADEIRAQKSGPQKQGFVNTSLQGVYGGMADLAGLPVDLLTMGYKGIDKLTGSKLAPDEPIGGSRWLRRAMRGFDRVEGWPKFTYDSVEDLHPSDRKWGVAGEAIGGSVLPTAGIFSMANRGTKAPMLLRSAVEAAKNSPGKFLAAETGMALGSGQGGAVAETVAPGDPTARFVGEVAGGFLNPTQAVRAVTKPIQTATNAVRTNFSRAGREDAAANILRDTLGRTGEDPNSLAAILRQRDPFDLNLTSGQETGSTGLLAIERRIAQSDPQFAARMDTRPDAANERLQQLGQVIANSGEPTDLRNAFRTRVGEANTNISSTRRAAEIDALRGREAIGNVSAPDMAAASSDARNVLSDARGVARGRERALWETIPKDTTLVPAETLAAREQIRSRLLPNEAMPAPIEAYTGNLERQGATAINTGVLDASGNPITRTEMPNPTSAEMLRLRNRALTRARQARAQGDFDLANQMDKIAEGALNDLGGLSDEARAYSREMNQRFTQGYAGDALARDSTGGPRIEPEQMLPRALGSGGSLGDVRMRQLSEASDFGGRGAEMAAQQDRFLRGVIQSTIDPQTGLVNPTKLAAWQQQNASLLSRFPQLRADLGTAETAQRSFERIQAITDKATRNANRTLIARVAGVDNPTVEIGKLLSDTNPNRAAQYSSIARAAQNAGPEAVAGLRSSTLQSAFKNATDSSGNFNFERLSYQLADQGVLEMMSKNGVIDLPTQQRLKAIVDRAVRLKESINTPAGMKSLVDDPDALTDFLTRTVGANIGAKLGGGSGATLVAASAGSKLMRKYFDKLPAAKVQEVLVEAAENPHFMAMLLQKPKTTQQAQQLAGRINAFLYSATAGQMSDAANADEEKN